METLLRLAGMLKEDENGNTDLEALEKEMAEKHNINFESTTPSSSSTAAAPKSELNLSKGSSVTFSPEPEGEETNVENLSDMMCSLVTNNEGSSRFFGSASGFSIFSPKGIEWVNQKTGRASFETMIQSTAIESQESNSHMMPKIFEEIFGRTIYLPLPSREEALELLSLFFNHFNFIFPLFHEETFMGLFERHYSSSYDNTSWWACYNVILAISHRLRVMSKITSAAEDEKAWGYLKNACSVFTELTMRNMDLMSVQALLGMAMFLLGTPNPQPAFFLVAAAMRVAQSIGLHKRGSGFNLPKAEQVQRNRVFWIAYIIDADICLRSGRPPAQDHDDMSIELPSADPDDHIGDVPLPSGEGKCNLFRVMAESALVTTKVYKQLYSTTAGKKSDGELLTAISQLDKELEEWKDSIPIEFRPGHEIQSQHTPLTLHIVTLHFSYYNCLITIHRMSIQQGYWSTRLAEFAIQGRNATALNPRVYNSALICVNAARSTIDLLKYVPQNDCASVW
jgi:hypothetical protein